MNGFSPKAYNYYLYTDDLESVIKTCIWIFAYTGLNLPHAREKPATSPENFRHLAGEGCQCKRETTYCEEHTKNV